MRVLMLSTDPTMGDPESPAGKRLAAYRTFADIRILPVRRDFFGALREGEEILKTFRPDVISAQDPFFVGLIGLMLARRVGAPLQVQVHTDFVNTAYIFESLKHFLHFLVALWVLPRASCVRAVSDRSAMGTRRFTRTPVSVVPIRVSPPPAAAARPPEFSDKFQLITVSRLTPEKRVDIAIRAIRDLPDAELNVIGDGPLRRELEALTHQLGLMERVRFLGWKSDLVPYYRYAGAFVQVSRYEGYGMALMEAALSGCPIVTTDVGAVGEVLERDRDVLLIPASVRAVTRAVGRLMNDPELRKSLAASALKDAEAHLVSEEAYLAKYRDALSCRAA